MMSAAGPLLMQPHRALQWSLVRTVNVHRTAPPFAHRARPCTGRLPQPGDGLSIGQARPPRWFPGGRLRSSGSAASRRVEQCPNVAAVVLQPDSRSNNGQAAQCRKFGQRNPCINVAIGFTRALAGGDGVPEAVVMTNRPYAAQDARGVHVVPSTRRPGAASFGARLMGEQTGRSRPSPMA